MRLEDRGRLQLDSLGLDQDGDDLARGETEGAVVQGAQELRYGARMRRDADPGCLVGDEDVVQDVLGADGEGSVRLGIGSLPQLVCLGKASLKLVEGEKMGDVGLTTQNVSCKPGCEKGYKKITLLDLRLQVCGVMPSLKPSLTTGTKG